MPAKSAEFRKLPSVDSILREIASEECAKGAPAKLAAECVRQAIAETRSAISKESAGPSGKDIRTAVIVRTRELMSRMGRPFYRRAINATGIILHTGLGRAVLPKQAVSQIAEELSGYSVLQIDVESGERSKRDEKIEWLLRELTGAEAATVVNNNAAATALVLNTVAAGREVIVSRGQLVEIGGSFRLPEVMAASGAKLVEVGTTNKTHARDYESAITPNTAAIMRVHPSNYRILGFTSEVALDELVRIAHAHNLALIDDVGSGALVDMARFGFKDEPTLASSVRAGADIVTSSADKLIGGSQGGIILGKANLVGAARKNPFARIVRAGKLTLAALEATLALFLDEETALKEVPTLARLARGVDAIGEQAKRLAARIRAGTKNAQVAILDGSSQMGSGSLPTEDLPTKLVAISPTRMSPDDLALALRRYEPPIVTRIHKDLVLIDPRTLLEGERETVAKAIVEILGA